jgi:hypothetical protein
MGPILQYISRHDVFDSDTLILLGEAYDKAVGSLNGVGQFPVVRETVAIRILELASRGERDPERLCQGALDALGSRL